jgi:copper chaperone CopZ
MKVLVVVAALAALSVPFVSRWSAQPQQQSGPTLKVATLNVTGMTCAGCEAAVRMAARSVEGVTDAEASYANRNAEVTYDPAKTTPEAIARVVSEKTGYGAESAGPAVSGGRQ